VTQVVFDSVLYLGILGSGAGRKLELTAKASMAQPVSQPAVCYNGLMQTLVCVM